MKVSFACYTTPIPQGSMKGFVVPAKAGRAQRVAITSDNPKLKAFRREVTRAAIIAIDAAGADGVMAGKHVPVEIKLDFVFERPASVSSKRKYPVVKPDADKLVRSTLDALTGYVYEDDAQVVAITAAKHYGEREGVIVSAWTLAEDLPAAGNLFPDPAPKEVVKPMFDTNW